MKYSLKYNMHTNNVFSNLTQYTSNIVAAFKLNLHPGWNVPPMLKNSICFFTDLTLKSYNIVRLTIDKRIKIDAAETKYCLHTFFFLVKTMHTLPTMQVNCIQFG